VSATLCYLLCCWQAIIAKDGVTGLFTRGLTTRIAANGLQNICFTVLWNLVRVKLTL
jgi:hypothetical protein